jgi:UDP-glucose 4-epimerase
MDLADGHVAALKYIQDRSAEKGYGKTSIFNLGTGRGYSVLEMLSAMSKACGRALPYEFGPRREGDLPEYYGDPRLAEEKLGWKATRTLDDICRGKC